MNMPGEDKPVPVAAPATAARGLAIGEIGLLVMSVLLLVAGFLYEFDRIGNAASRQFDLKGSLLAAYAGERLAPPPAAPAPAPTRAGARAERQHPVEAAAPATAAPASAAARLDAALVRNLLDTQGVIGEAILVDARGGLVAREGEATPGETYALPSDGLNHWTDTDNTTWSAAPLADGQWWLLYRVPLREQLQAALWSAAPAGLVLVLVALLVVLLMRHRDAMDQVAEHERRDALTRAYNRLGLFEEAVPLRAVARRNKKPLAVLVLDIDYFRQLNEQFGHEAGDKVLKAIAGGLAEKVREYDLVARWANEVFVVVLMVEAEADAYLVGERLRGLAASACHRDALLKVTVSAGLVMLPPEEKLEAAIARGEEMLQAAKAAGRDRLVAGPEVIRPGTAEAAAAAAAAPVVAPTAESVGAPAHLTIESIAPSVVPEGVPDPLDPGAAFRQR